MRVNNCEVHSERDKHGYHGNSIIDTLWLKGNKTNKISIIQIRASHTKQRCQTKNRTNVAQAVWTITQTRLSCIERSFFSPKRSVNVRCSSLDKWCHCAWEQHSLWVKRLDRTRCLLRADGPWWVEVLQTHKSEYWWIHGIISKVQ